MIYFIQAEGVGHIKIGYTGDDDARFRLAELQVGSPVPLKLLGTTPGGVEDEKNLHRRFAAFRVTGERFKPVPELLALIPGSEPRSCGGVEVAERSVTIRVLTVGRKQFTKTLLEQLPERDLLAAIEHFADAEGPAQSLAGFVQGDAWGWVVGGASRNHHRDDHNFACCDEHVYRWVVFEHGGRLYRSRHYVTVAGFAWHTGLYAADAAVAFELARRLPGLREQDQLFFGV